MLLRPEEIHRRSREDDVVPPLPCRDEHVEQVIALHRLLIAHIHGERLAAIGARALDAAVAVQSGADGERVRGACPVSTKRRYRKLRIWRSSSSIVLKSG